ncbi:hypothetical protein V8C34DRAFT_155961 [Trichoderma compactum]
MMEGFQSRVSEPNSSALSEWIPVAACQPWAVRTYSSHSGGGGGGQHRHDPTASSTSYGSTCAKAAGYPVLLVLKCMLAGFAANNKGHNGHWREELEEEDTLPRKRSTTCPSRALRAGKLAGRLNIR